MNIDKLKRKVDKCKDGDKLDALLEEWELTIDDDELFYELEEYISDRKEEIHSSLNPSGLDYPLYDHTVFRVASKSWQELNPDNLSYWKWLVEIGLPRFWEQPRPDLQHVLLAIFCGINSNAVPPRNKSARKELALPLGYFYGESGSGKTEGNYIISHSYPVERFQLIKAEATGTSLRNVCHQLCYRGFTDSNPGHNNLFPAYLLIDNYEPERLARWGDFKTVLLSVLRTQSFTTTANVERSNDYYYTHLLKSFTSVIPPKAMSTAMQEFSRRFIYFFTNKSENVQSIASYDFSDIPGEYSKLWCQDRVVVFWYPILADLLQRDDNSTSIPANRWAQSLCCLATGVYLELFQDINQGIEFFTEYWHWVDTQEEDFNNEVSVLIDDMTDAAISLWDTTIGESGGLHPDMKPNLLPKILVCDIEKRIRSGVLSKRNSLEDAKNYLCNIKHWQYHVNREKGQIEMFYYLPWERLCDVLPDLLD